MGGPEHIEIQNVQLAMDEGVIAVLHGVSHEATVPIGEIIVGIAVYGEGDAQISFPMGSPIFFAR